MAVAQAYGKTVTSGSVFAYDVADTRNSYKGEPTTNVFQHYGTVGQGSGADNGVTFAINGTGTFVRLGYGQSFGGYTIKPEDVVYKYDLGAYGCHYHGNAPTIPSGKYLTFSFDYYVSPGTTIDNTTLAALENYAGSALSTVITAPNTLTGVWQTVSVTVGPTGGSGTQGMFLYPGYCGPRFGNTGYILYKNPQVEYLPHKTPFEQTTRSATQALLPIVKNSTINLTNTSFDSDAQISLDGTSDFIRIDQDGNYFQPSFTWEMVVKFTSIQNTYQGLVWAEGSTQGEIGYSGEQYLLSLYNNEYFHYRIQNTTTGWTNTNTSAIDFNPQDYNHIVWQFSNGTTRIYINGKLFHTDTSRGSYNGGKFSSFFLGARNDGVFSSAIKIPVSRLYNRILSADEVKQNFDFYDARFGIEYDTYYFAVSNRATRYNRRWEADGTEGDISGENMATTTPAYTLYQKPDASFQSPDNYIEVARDDIGTPARLTEYGVQTSYRNGKWFTSVTVYKGRRGGPLRFEFPNGGTSTYGEEFYKTIVAPYVS